MDAIKGLDDVCAALGRLRGVAPRAARAAMFACGERCKQTASNYAPKSPTMKQLSATLKRKKRTGNRTAPGGLEKSIAREHDENHASIFVPSNALCVSESRKTGRRYNYAKRIHDERGISWHNLGPGSRDKSGKFGGKVGEKFIERAIKDNADWCEGKITEELERALHKAWR